MATHFTRLAWIADVEASMAPRKLRLDPPCANGRHRGPSMDEDSMADHDAEFAYGGEDPWQTVRRALNVVSLDAVGGERRSKQPLVSG